MMRGLPWPLQRGHCTSRKATRQNEQRVKTKGGSSLEGTNDAIGSIQSGVTAVAVYEAILEAPRWLLVISDNIARVVDVKGYAVCGVWRSNRLVGVGYCISGETAPSTATLVMAPTIRTSSANTL